jgi:hypothetical protein
MRLSKPGGNRLHEWEAPLDDFVPRRRGFVVVPESSSVVRHGEPLRQRPCQKHLIGMPDVFGLVRLHEAPDLSGPSRQIWWSRQIRRRVTIDRA